MGVISYIIETQEILRIIVEFIFFKEVNTVMCEINASNYVYIYTHGKTCHIIVYEGNNVVSLAIYLYIYIQDGECVLLTR